MAIQIKESPRILICPKCKPKTECLEAHNRKAMCRVHGLIYDFENDPPSDDLCLPAIQIVGLKKP